MLCESWLAFKIRFERKELCKTLKMKHANRPLLNFRVCQVEMCILDFEGSQCSVTSYANSHDGRMFFLTQMILQSEIKINAPFPFSFTRIEWVNCFSKERSCVEQNETREQPLPADVYSGWYSLISKLKCRRNKYRCFLLVLLAEKLSCTFSLLSGCWATFIAITTHPCVTIRAVTNVRLTLSYRKILPVLCFAEDSNLPRVSSSEILNFPRALASHCFHRSQKWSNMASFTQVNNTYCFLIWSSFLGRWLTPQTYLLLWT